MKCWICGDEADSREHRIKASDIRAVFGQVDADHPLYLHSEIRKNRRIHGVRSKTLKRQASICARCNNERTQAYDQAWERLSQYLMNRSAAVHKGARIRLDKVFPGSVHKSMLAVHLFFAKLFGCAIIEASIPIPIEPFGRAIESGSAHPHLYLGFWDCIGLPGKRQVGLTPVVTAEVQGHVAYATWFYDLGRFAVNIVYSEPDQKRQGLQDAWHPDTGTKLLRIKGK